MSPWAQDTQRTSRPRRRLVAGVLAMLLALVFGQVAAYASHYQASLEGSNFQIDNNANFLVDSPNNGVNLDWDVVTEARQQDLATGTNDDSYSGGTKEDTVCPMTTTGSIPNNKSDLKTFGIYKEPGSPGFLHLFWTRVSEPSGTTLMDFEFNKSKVSCAVGVNKVRTTGDMLVEYSIVQGGARATITIRRWTGSAWGPATMLDQGDATGTINSSAITAANTAGVSDVNLSARTFGEASIDLSVIFDSTKCESFGSAMLKSRSSDSFTSQLKDFIAPLPIDLTNCGKVIIHKNTDPDEADANFGFTKAFSTDPATSDTFTLNDKSNDTIEFDNVVLGNDYTVEEDTLPTGWEFVSVDCSASVGVTLDSTVGSKITFDIDSVSDVLECTYLNRAKAKLTVVKQSEVASTFDFTGTGTGVDANFSLTTTGAGAAGQASTSFSDLAPGSYSVAETDKADWNLTSATCDNGDAPSAITLDGGDDVTCTFVNVRERGAIEITKTRKHAAAGGTAPHAGVKFTVSGNGITPVEVTTNAQGKACVPNLLDGSYTVTEEDLAAYSEEAAKSVSVTAEGTCTTGTRAGVSFVNTPLTDVTVSVDSLVDGGTASTISCKDKDGNVVKEDLTNAPGDVSVKATNLLPTAPGATLICTIVVDP